MKDDINVIKHLIVPLTLIQIIVFLVCLHLKIPSGISALLIIGTTLTFAILSIVIIQLSKNW